MKIQLSQINPTIGDMQGNVALIADGIEKASAAGVTMVVFPELCITGYYPRDLLEEPGFMTRVEEAVTRVMSLSRKHPNLWIVIGAPLFNGGVGKRLFNALLVIKDGSIVGRQFKQLLPTYGVFDEVRHFEQGDGQYLVLDIDNQRVGFLVCEDIWNFKGLDYAKNPILDLANIGVDMLVSINASPSHLKKRTVRHELGRWITGTLNATLIYVNQVGGHDDLVYDGASFVMSPKGALVEECARFESDHRIVEIQGKLHWSAQDRSLDQDMEVPEFYRRQIVLGLRDYARRTGFKKVIVGSSGGIDSALTLALAAEALGPKHVTAITMPSRHSSDGSVSDSQLLCDRLGVRLHYHGIQQLMETEAAAFGASFTDGLTAPTAQITGLAYENLQARLRGVILMTYSNQYGGLVLTTGNKSELAVGYYTLFGDSVGGLNLIGDLYKTEVFALARHLVAADGTTIIPQSIIDKAPSAELADGQKDEDALPPYWKLDALLKGLIEFEEEGLALIQSIDNNGSHPDRDVLQRVRGLIARSEYKRRMAAPIIRVRPRAFGAGRQIPISAKVM